jgi:competence protein ComEA
VLFALAICILFTGCSTDPQRPAALLKTDSIDLERAVNINTASAPDLQTIPHVGEKLAMKIIEHRRRYGPFRRPEHLMLIDGIGDKRFRKIRHLIRVE